jgi:hypothetical protein
MAGISYFIKSLLTDFLRSFAAKILEDSNSLLPCIRLLRASKSSESSIPKAKQNSD